MKIKKIVLVFTAVAGLGICFELNSKPTGAPAGSTGSPADGVTCFQSGCHFGSPVAKTGIVSSDIPTSGYVPGATYNMTVSFSGTGNKGFQISPQTSSGTLVGSLIAGTGNKIVNSKYITHTGVKSSTTATWTFKWVAPAAGTGSVTFYCACAVTRNNTWTTTYTTNEGVAAGIIPDKKAEYLSAFPNPFTNGIHVGVSLKSGTPVSIWVYALNGQLVHEQYHPEVKVGLNDFAIDLTAIQKGVYILKLEQDGELYTSRIVKN